MTNETEQLLNAISSFAKYKLSKVKGKLTEYVENQKINEQFEDLVDFLSTDEGFKELGESAYSLATKSEKPNDVRFDKEKFQQKVEELGGWHLLLQNISNNNISMTRGEFKQLDHAVSFLADVHHRLDFDPLDDDNDLIVFVHLAQMFGLKIDDYIIGGTNG